MDWFPMQHWRCWLQPPGLVAAWGHDTHELRLAQATAKGDAGLDEAAAKSCSNKPRSSKKLETSRALPNSMNGCWPGVRRQTALNIL